MLRRFSAYFFLFYFGFTVYADPNSVIVLGAGIGGLTAAHELVERGYKVTVYESSSVAGGKARSIGIQGTGIGGRRDLPGEHGFRIFPGIYRHINDTIARIPFGNGSVLNALTLPPVAYADRSTGEDRIAFPTGGRSAISKSGLTETVRQMFRQSGWIASDQELSLFVQKLLYILTSSPERRLAELETISWWDFIEAETQSMNYQKFFATGTARTLVAMKPKVASARTMGEMFIQLLLAAVDENRGGLDRILTGPTNDVWFDPWVSYLESKGVDFHFNSKVLGFTFANGHIENVMVDEHGVTVPIVGKYYISALPVDVMRKLSLTSRKFCYQLLC